MPSVYKSEGSRLCPITTKKIADWCCWFTVHGEFYRSWRVLVCRHLFLLCFVLINSFYFLFLTFYISSHFSLFCVSSVLFTIFTSNVPRHCTIYATYKSVNNSLDTIFLIISLNCDLVSFLFPFAFFISHFCRFFS